MKKLKRIKHSTLLKFITTLTLFLLVPMLLSAVAAVAAEAQPGLYSASQATRIEDVLRRLEDRLGAAYNDVRNRPDEQGYPDGKLLEIMKASFNDAKELLEMTGTTGEIDNPSPQVIYGQLARMYHHTVGIERRFWQTMKPNNKAAKFTLESTLNMTRTLRGWLRAGVPGIEESREVLAQVERLTAELRRLEQQVTTRRTELSQLEGRAADLERTRREVTEVSERLSHLTAEVNAAEARRAAAEAQATTLKQMTVTSHVNYTAGRFGVKDEIANLAMVTSPRGVPLDTLQRHIAAQLNGQVTSLLGESVMTIEGSAQSRFRQTPLYIDVGVRLTGFEAVPRAWFRFWEQRAYRVTFQLEGMVSIPWERQAQTSAPLTVIVRPGQAIELSNDSRVMVSDFFTEVVDEAKHLYVQASGRSVENLLRELAARGVTAQGFLQAVSTRPAQAVTAAEANAERGAVCASKLSSNDQSQQESEETSESEDAAARGAARRA